MPVLRAAVQLPAKLSAGKSFLQDVVNDAGIRVYTAQADLACSLSNALSAFKLKTATAAKQAATAIMPLYTFMR